MAVTDTASRDASRQRPTGTPNAPVSAEAFRAGPVSLRFRRAATSLVAFLLPAALILFWQFSGTGGVVFGGALPTPDRVWTAWYNWAFGTPTFGLNPYVGTWVQNVAFSAERVIKGFLLAIAAGVPLGIAIGWSRITASIVDPTIQWLRPIPITAWLPISIAIFGIRDFGAIFLITVGAFYPIVINATQGARDVDKNWIRAGLMMGASRTAIMTKVVLPAAMPSIFTGLRIGLGIAWTAVIVAEMVAVKSGLGYVLWDAYYVGRMDIVLADMVSIGLLGYLSDRLIIALSSWLLKWHRLQAYNH